MSFDTSSSRSSGSYFDGSFDYRSLIPSGFPGSDSGGGGSQQFQTSYVAVQQDVENSPSSMMMMVGGGSSNSSSSTSAGTAISGCTEMCGGWIPEMTWKERLIGCATCMIAGYLLSLGSFFRIRDLLFGDPVPLVMNSTVGNLIALMGSCFLSGPTNQLNRMWAQKRRTATTMYLGSLALTIIVVMIPLPGPKGLLLLLLLLSQYVSITWYCLSYIPMAQEFVSGYLKRWITNSTSGNDGEY